MRLTDRAAETAGLGASFSHPVAGPLAAGNALAVLVGARGGGEVVARGVEVLAAAAAGVAALQAGGGGQAPPAALADHVVVVSLHGGK